MNSIISIITAFRQDILNGLKEGKNELMNFFEIGGSRYIEDQYKKFSKTNTFLFPDEKIDFEEVYFPLTLSTKNEQVKSDTIIQTLLNGNSVVGIVGEAGTGKSMVMRQIYLSLYHYKGSKIPIFIELRHLNLYQGTVKEFIFEQILLHKVKLSSKILERALVTGNFVFFFDGLDEVNHEKSNKFYVDLESFIDSYSTNSFIISSRPGISIEGLLRTDVVYISPLLDREIESFIHYQLNHTKDFDLIKKIIETIRATTNNDYHHYLKNPLLLSMFILAYKTFPELPKLKNKFYANVFYTLTTRHDSAKGGAFQHSRKTKLQVTEIESILKLFSFISLMEGVYTFDERYLTKRLNDVKIKLKLSFDVYDLIYDLQVSISVIILDGQDYRFPHRTLQDYFSALFISEKSEEAKRIIYEQHLFKFKFDIIDNDSFTGLLMEVDKFQFYRFFIIKVLNYFQEEIEELSDDDKVLKYFIDRKTGFTILENEDTLYLQKVNKNPVILDKTLKIIKSFDNDFIAPNPKEILVLLSQPESRKFFAKLDDNNRETPVNTYHIEMKTLPESLLKGFVNTVSCKPIILRYYQELKECKRIVCNEIENDKMDINEILGSMI